MDAWNPWHGCHKISPGCKNCYVYRRDNSFGKEAGIVNLTKSFDLPVRRKANGAYRLQATREVFTCGTSDFFIEEADEWRADAWKCIRERQDLKFLIITKRIQRFLVNLPADWGNGYDHVCIGCTVENQEFADKRLPDFLNMPIRHRVIIAEPLLEAIELSKYLGPGIEMASIGGESGPEGRVCQYEWLLGIREQCREKKVPFHFRQTGTHFGKDGRIFEIPRRLQFAQAKKAKLDLFY